ncbi:MAG: CHAT domain-containing protein, partial [Anaerolineae bacterium]|nr:CHAT domain-containing protein [Anaerolineae bacterium]
AAYLASRNQAGERGLRIKVGLDDAGDMEHWPWELLRDPSGDFLALSRQTPLIRHPRHLAVRPLTAVTMPLRVLVLISSPKDQEPLDVEGEWRALEEATADLRRRGLLMLDRVDDAQLNTLQRMLRADTTYQIFHYIGHAVFDERSQTGVIAFEDPATDNTAAVSAEALARELSEESGIRLVVMNACQGARTNRADPFAGIASALVARGIPGVVAMQFAITDNASRVFSTEFYRALSEGYAVEASMAEARRAISNTLNNLEWATPVLYLRAPSGVLFPRKSSYEPAVSTGGLREVILRPPVLIGLALALMACLILFIGPRLGPDPGPTPTPTGDRPPAFATLTPTPPSSVANIDLRVESLRYLPPDPAPGQQVTIAIRIRNGGTSDSGPFGWVWFRTSPQENPTPTLQGEVPNLGPGLSTTIITSYRFPWWGTWTSTAWVNFDGRAEETNIFNNINARTVSTSNAAFENAFTHLPDNTLIEASALEGDEFAEWGVLVEAESPPGPCTDATPGISIADDVNQLGTGLAGQPGLCTDLPIVFSLVAPPNGPALTQATVGFIATTAGTYSLELLRPDGSQLNTATLDVAEPSTQQSLSVGAQGAGFNEGQLIFRGPTGGLTAIRRLILERVPA